MIFFGAALASSEYEGIAFFVVEVSRDKSDWKENVDYAANCGKMGAREGLAARCSALSSTLELQRCNHGQTFLGRVFP